MAESESLPEKEIVLGLKSNNTAMVYDSLVSLRKTYVPNVSKMRKLALEEGVIKLVIEHLEHPKFCSIALSIIANCCMDDTLRGDVIKNRGIIPLVRILKGLANSEILNRACRALGNIALTETGLGLVLDSKPVGGAVSFLKSTDVKEYQMTAVRTLRILGRNKKKHCILEKENALHAIAELLTSDQPEVVKCSVKALALLLHGCTPVSAVQIKKAEAVPVLVRLYSDSIDSSVKDNALSCLESLARACTVGTELSKAGAFEIFMEVGKSEENEHKIQSAVMALCFCSEDFHERKKIQELDGLSFLIDILQADNHENIHPHVIVAIIKLCSGMSNSEELYKLKIFQVLTERLRKFIEKHKSDDCETKVPESENLEKDDGDKDQLKLKANAHQGSDSRKFHNLTMVDKKMKLELTPATSPTVSTTPVRTTDAVFSIHSPTYQGVQYSEVSAASSGQNSYASFSSPLGCATQCSSPDRYSCDWSPSSPASSSLYSPFTPSSPRENMCWSPVLSSRSHSPESQHDPDDSPHVDEVEQNPESPVQKTSDSINSQIIRMQSVPLVFIRPNDITGLSQEHILSGESKGVYDDYYDDSPLSPPVFFDGFVFQGHGYSSFPSSPDSDSSTNKSGTKRKLSEDSSHCDNMSKKNILSECLQSISNLCKKEKNKVDASRESIDYYLLLLLSHLIHQFLPSSKWISVGEMNPVVLVEYLAYIPSANLRVKQILQFLITDHFSFHKLIVCDFIQQVDKLLCVIHDPSACDRCSSRKKLKEELLQSSKKMAAQACEKSTLQQFLLSKDTLNQLYCLYAISRLFEIGHICRILHKTNGISLIIDFLLKDDPKFFTTSAKALSHVWKKFGRIDNKKEPIQSLCNIYCKYDFMLENHMCNLTLLTDDGSEIPTSKTHLCGRSEYFRVLLDGQFVEASQKIVTITAVSAKVLLSVAHCLHGCASGWCPLLSKLSLDDLLQLLHAADLFLLNNLKAEMQMRLLARFHHESAPKVYAASKLYGTQEYLDMLLCHVFHYGYKYEKEYLNCIRELLDSNKEDTVHYIETYLTQWSAEVLKTSV